MLVAFTIKKENIHLLNILNATVYDYHYVEASHAWNLELVLKITELLGFYILGSLTKSYVMRLHTYLFGLILPWFEQGKGIRTYSLTTCAWETIQNKSSLSILRFFNKSFRQEIKGNVIWDKPSLFH